uniref:Uncharacterized protein n=1 Tax=Aegilops tauschii TaxID=37682 RepID=N1QTG2_AEGTA
MAVCDPLSRRYVLLPPIPTDLAVQEEHPLDMVPILAPIGDDEDEMSFKVICLATYGSKITAFVFSSVTQQWCIAASIARSLSGVDYRPLGLRMSPTYGFRGLSGFDNQTNGESSSDWQLENIIPLPRGYDYFTVSAAEGLLFLGATTEDQVDFDIVSGVPLSRTDWDVDYFSLEVKTSELRKLLGINPCKYDIGYL